MPVHCGPQSEQDLPTTQEGSGSATPSMMDQIKVMQENMHENMSQLLQKAVQEEEGWKRQIASLEAENLENINRLQDERSMLGAELESTKCTLYDSQKYIKRLQKEKDTLEAEVESLKCTLDDRRQYVNNLQQQYDKLEEKVEGMEQQNINSLQQENNMLKAKVQSMACTLDERKENINSLQKEQSALDTKVKDLVQTLYERQQSIYSLQQKKGSLEAKVQELEETEQMHTQRIHDLIMSKHALYKTLYSPSYPMRYRVRRGKENGCALIINNTQFTTSEMRQRTGAEGDTEKLTEAFRRLPVNTEVKTHQNLDLPNMLNVLREEANRDHTDEDFFICCIMSHGTQGKVFAADGLSVELLDILSFFKGKRCPSLKGKPKLFFISACQGDKDQTSEREGAHSDASPSPILAYLSTEADFFLALATVPGYVSYRREDGADFVNVLAKVLKEDGGSQDLMSMMATVCRELNKKYKYSPFYCTTLTHKLFFKPYLHLSLDLSVFPQDLPLTSSLPPTIETPNDRYRPPLLRPLQPPIRDVTHRHRHRTRKYQC